MDKETGREIIEAPLADSARERGKLRVANGEADTVTRAVVRALHTLTWDNGSEFAGHALIGITRGEESLRRAVLLLAARLSSQNVPEIFQQPREIVPTPFFSP
jgi:hypothetical protein